MITGPQPDRVDEVVRRLGAVQAQDYLASLWAIGLRLENATESAVERAVAEGRIVRTWPMRGTLHFVAAPDVRWMLDHFAVRTFASRASWYRQLELDRAVFAKSRKVISRALERDKRLTRPGAYQVLDRDLLHEIGDRRGRSPDRLVDRAIDPRRLSLDSHGSSRLDRLLRRSRRRQTQGKYQKPRKLDTTRLRGARASHSLQHRLTSSARGRRIGWDPK
jgi:hypothetical protein